MWLLAVTMPVFDGIASDMSGLMERLTTSQNPPSPGAAMALQSELITTLCMHDKYYIIGASLTFTDVRENDYTEKYSGSM